MAIDRGLLTCIVGNNAHKTFRFDSKLWVSSGPHDRELKPDFYRQGGGSDSLGTRYELELTSMPWQNLGVSRALVHVHSPPGTRREFVCYTAPLETEDHAREFFVWWCLGTVYTAETGVPFEQILEAHPDDMPAFIEAQLGIRLIRHYHNPS